MTLHTQVITMIAMIIGGMYLGFATETYRRVVHRFRHTLIVRYGLEIIYWLVQTGLLFYLLYRMNDGEVRFYVLLACLLGFSIYVVLCMPWYRKLLDILIHMVKKLVRWTIDCLNLLVIRPVIWIGRLLLLVLLFVYKIVTKLLYICLYPWIFLVKRFVPAPILKKISQIPLFCSTMIHNVMEVWKRTWRKWR